jgi:hypothetical protein
MRRAKFSGPPTLAISWLTVTADTVTGAPAGTSMAPWTNSSTREQGIVMVLWPFAALAVSSSAIRDSAIMGHGDFIARPHLELA